MTEAEYHKKIESLEKEILELQSQNKKHNAIMSHQTKMASMGEMLGNIAHQWRQPLMEISAHMMNVEAQIKVLGKTSNEEVLEMIEKSTSILDYMSVTIDDFRHFFAKDQKQSSFKVSSRFNSVLNVISNALSNKNIKLDIIVKDNPSLYGYPNDFSQVLINIVLNAKDMLVHRKIEAGHIEIKVIQEENNCIVTITDNAGGIKVEPIEQIFDPMFSQEKKDGTGIGLFMSKYIIEEKMNGQIKASNRNDGAVFTLSLPIE